MAVKIRLQRRGKKGQPFYHIVIADARVARDGKFIDKIGSYNPLTIPATIELDVDKAMQWLKNGAQPTDTARAILSYKGVMLKRHLQIGVDKGAISQEVADNKYNAWVSEKEAKIAKIAEQKSNERKTAEKKAFDAEVAVNKQRAEAIAKKRAEIEEAQRKAAQEAKQKEEEAKAALEAKPQEAKAEEISAEPEAPKAE
jgi:ribosomal protein S16